jgi:hypothetical protein
MPVTEMKDHVYKILERDEFRLRRILHFRSNWRIPLR